MRADVRIRIRGSVIRVRISEACIRTVIRITAEQKPTRATNLLSFTHSLQGENGRAARSPIIGLLAFRQEAEARADGRSRTRGSAKRIRTSEARARTARRTTAKQKPTEDCTR